MEIFIKTNSDDLEIPTHKGHITFHKHNQLLIVSSDIHVFRSEGRDFQDFYYSSLEPYMFRDVKIKTAET